MHEAKRRGEGRADGVKMGEGTVEKTQYEEE